MSNRFFPSPLILLLLSEPASTFLPLLPSTSATMLSFRSRTGLRIVPAGRLCVTCWLEVRLSASLQSPESECLVLLHRFHVLQPVSCQHTTVSGRVLCLSV